jgi:hypothetical protein
MAERHNASTAIQPLDMRVCLIAGLVLILAGTTGNGGEPSKTKQPKEEPLAFSHCPIDLDAIRSITPLGNLNPRGGHVFPTDHIYFDYAAPKTVAVYAPARGTIIAFMKRNDEVKIEVRFSETIHYYLDHFVPEPGLKQGSVLEAGQALGKTTGRGMFDMGCYDTRTTLKGFVNLERYPLPTRHALSPLKYFAEPLRTKLYAKVQRPGDKVGKIDFDVKGTLAGNWFLQGLTVADSSRGSRDIWEKQLAFVPDPRRPPAQCVSIGGSMAGAGIYPVEKDTPDFARETPQSGTVTLRVTQNGKPAVLLVKMLAEDRIQVQFFTETEKPEFTKDAKVYTR